MTSSNTPDFKDLGQNIIQLNVGGALFTTTKATLCADANSIFSAFFENGANSPSDKSVSSKPFSITSLDDSALFIDRDGALFRYILDYLRSAKLVLPEGFSEIARLQEEAKFYKLPALVKQLRDPKSGRTKRGQSAGNRPNAAKKADEPKNADKSGEALAEGGHITVGYRGSFYFGRDGQVDVKFRKLNRILIAGKASLCRAVFGEGLNETRDPDRGGENRYTSRLYLKHTSLESAFDHLSAMGFRLLTSCGSGACNPVPHLGMLSASAVDLNMPRPTAGGGLDSEEMRWNHYNEFVFYKEPVILTDCKLADDWT